MPWSPNPVLCSHDPPFLRTALITSEETAKGRSGFGMRSRNRRRKLVGRWRQGLAERRFQVREEPGPDRLGVNLFVRRRHDGKRPGSNLRVLLVRLVVEELQQRKHDERGTGGEKERVMSKDEGKDSNCAAASPKRRRDENNTKTMHLG